MPAQGSDGKSNGWEYSFHNLSEDSFAISSLSDRVKRDGLRLLGGIPDIKTNGNILKTPYSMSLFLPPLGLGKLW